MNHNLWQFLGDQKFHEILPKIETKIKPKKDEARIALDYHYLNDIEFSRRDMGGNKTDRIEVYDGLTSKSNIVCSAQSRPGKIKTH